MINKFNKNRSTNNTIISIHKVIAALVFSGLSACGGASTPPASRPQIITTPTPIPIPTPPPIPRSNVTEYNNSDGLGIINADAAYQQDITGSGVIIASLDNGVDDGHRELISNIHPSSRNFGNTDGLIETLYFEDGSRVPGPIHGTMTSGIMVAAQDGFGMHGVAYDAELMMLKMSKAVETSDGWVMRSAFDQFPAAIDHAIDNGAKVLLLEWALWDSSKNDYTPSDHQISDLYQVAPELVGPIRESFKRAIDAGITIVIPSGNDYASASTYFVSTIGLDPGYENSIIIVGGVDHDEQAYDRANNAGYAADYFVVAPTSVYSTFPTSGDFAGANRSYITTTNGTSFAGPYVAGMAALLLQKFPELTPREVIQIITDTAKDLGDPGVDEIYGHGLIDIEAAFSPQGTLAVQSANGASIILKESFAQISPGFGDAFSNKNGLGLVSILDKYNREFKVSLSQQINETARSGISLEAFIDQQNKMSSFKIPVGKDLFLSSSFNTSAFTNKHILPNYMQGQSQHSNASVSFSAKINPKINFGISHGVSIDHILSKNSNQTSLLPSGLLSTSTQRNNFSPNSQQNMNTVSINAIQSETFEFTFVSGVQSIAADNIRFGNNANEQNNILSAMALNWKKDRTQINLSFGAMKENGSMLGSQSVGAVGLPNGATTKFSQASIGYDFSPRLSFFGSVKAGLTTPNNYQTGLLTSMNSFASTSFQFGIIKSEIWRENDRLVLALSQPIRVESGTAVFRMPTEYNRATNKFTYSNQRINLSPSGREINLELSYQTRILANAFISFNALAQRQAGHIKDNAISGAFLLRGMMKF